MRRFDLVRSAFLFAASAALFAQAPPAGEAQQEYKGIPPRAGAGEYLSQAKVGAIAIGAEFKGHVIVTLQDDYYTTEDYVVVEVGLYGAEGARTTISVSDFVLRINGKKTAPGQNYAVVLAGLKDPSLEPTKSEREKSKTSVNSGGGGQQQTNEPPAPIKIPVPVLRAMGKKVQAMALPEGDRVLPQTGLIFFAHRGKVESIRSLELLYEGPAGKATLTMQP